MQALQERASATSSLYADPHNPHRHITRGLIHERLGFPDLAAADAYRALSLLDSVVDPDGCEFHARKRVAEAAPPAAKDDEEEADDEEENGEGLEPVTEDEYNVLIGPVYALLVRSLVRCGCLRDAYEFALRGRAVLDELASASASDEASVSKKDLEEHITLIKREYHTSTSKSEDEEVDPSLLKAQGFARRILYRWNTHEPDRKSPETLELLNERLKSVAPKCEVRAVALPVLHNQSTFTTNSTNQETKNERGEEKEEEVSIQLGLFAKEPLLPGETILHESSLLTATNRLHDDTCDACNGPLPALDAEQPPVACEECYDIIFCSQSCHDKAQEIYHGAVCGLMENLENIGKDIPDAKDKADYLYLLLLGRALAMAETQGVHPLELPEVKYIWGDFVPEPVGAGAVPEKAGAGTLPFSFHLSVLQPMRLIEEMQLDPYTTLPNYDTWVLNTLYAKFRGTASGRLSTWDGGPETCAVHPLWCLANHSCDPNVRWEWGGEIAFVVRSECERVKWKRKGGEEKGLENRGVGIQKDEEILNHYCDVELDVKERREWAAGALGGSCLCGRCVWEAGEVDA
ncbi:putative MYND domain protein [Aspergillus undulatus]|uniref:putative MYND domain protein n=1 Tax=Aspergillus undulatus TaxID=1810928 RepID=UPI003CCCE881